MLPPMAMHCVVRVSAGHALLSSPHQDEASLSLSAEAGTTAAIETGSASAYAWSAVHRATLTFIDPEVFNEVARRAGVDGRIDRANGGVRRIDDPVSDLLLSILAKDSVAASASQHLLMTALGSALACRLVDSGSAAMDVECKAASALHPRVVARVRTFIENHLGERLSLQDIARVAGMSRFHFARQFRLCTGESPMGYLTRMRIERGKRMLRDGGTSIADMAASLGFADQSHFTRTFRRVVGMAPGSFGYASKRSSPASISVAVMRGTQRRAS